MSYKRSITNKALGIIEKRRNEAELEADRKRENVFEKVPKIEKINDRLTAIGYETVVTTFSDAEKAQKLEKLEKLKQESLALQEKRRLLLIENGFNEDELNKNYTCKACNDTGYVDGYYCTCLLDLRKQLQKEEIARFADINRCTFENFSLNCYPDSKPDGDTLTSKERATKIFENCRTYAQTFTTNSKNLVIQGATGLGKTHIALAIANVVINKGYSATYAEANSLLPSLVAEHFKRETFDYNLKNVIEADLLIIDDLGSEDKSTVSNNCLMQVLNGRYNKPTIITTNLTGGEISELYDQRITSRLLNRSWLYLTGEDIRSLNA